MIELEYFLPIDGGIYEKRKGIIKKDTILLKKFSPYLYEKRNRYDTIFLSKYPLKH
jgi:hypothetical protein